MLISQIIGAYSLGSADLLRRAMEEEKSRGRAEQRELFQERPPRKRHDLKLAVKGFLI